jgi:hypothetical protein
MRAGTRCVQPPETPKGNNLGPFMATVVALSQPVPIEVAIALAHERPGLETRAARLIGERDEHFRLSAADGAAHLEIAHAAGSLEFAVNRKC